MEVRIRPYVVFKTKPAVRETIIPGLGLRAAGGTYNGMRWTEGSRRVLSSLCQSPNSSSRGRSEARLEPSMNSEENSPTFTGANFFVLSFIIPFSIGSAKVCSHLCGHHCSNGAERRQNSDNRTKAAPKAVKFYLANPL